MKSGLNLKSLNSQNKQVMLLNKLILLFVFDKMEIPLTENSIIDICTGEKRWLNYMYCKDALWKLVNTGLIYQPSKEKDVCYAITNEGRTCIEHFYNKIPQTVRDEITEYARTHRSYYKRIQEYIASYSKERDGFYSVTLKIKESVESNAVFELKMRVPSRTVATNLSSKWCDIAPSFYEYCYEKLIIENDKDEDDKK